MEDPGEATATIAAARRGDARGFEVLVRAHQGPLRAWLRAMTGDAERADEVAQDAFLRAWQRLDQFEGRGRFRAWLFTLARRTFLDALRRDGREQAFLQAWEAEGQDPGAGLEPGPETMTEVLELGPALARLTPAERDCLLLTQLWGLSMQETSATLGMPVGTVKSHVHRARDRVTRSGGDRTTHAAHASGPGRALATENGQR